MNEYQIWQQYEPIRKLGEGTREKHAGLFVGEESSSLTSSPLIRPGSFGAAFLCRERASGDHWVVKKVAVPEHPVERDRAHKEAKLQQLLRHPHIVYCKCAAQPSVDHAKVIPLIHPVGPYSQAVHL